jgi:hypothetical protein
MPTPWQKATTDTNNPMPWTAAGPGHVPVWGPWHAGGSPSGPIIDSPPSAQPPASIMPNTGATVGDYDPDQRPGWRPNPNLPGTLGARATTAGQPTLGFPAQTNPFGNPPPNQMSSLPGSMFASAQNLIKLLFPGSVG